MSISSLTNRKVNQDNLAETTERSKEIVIALVGYAGAGCSSIAGKLINELSDQGYYDPIRIKFSNLIVQYYSKEEIPSVKEAPNEGTSKFERAIKLQNLGDNLRAEKSEMALSALAIKEIIRARGTEPPGEKKRAFILDSIKHFDEIDLLRQVYGKTFYLLAIHCDQLQRQQRLIGSKKSGAKFAGVDRAKVLEFLERDEKDATNSAGQQVIKAFHHADYFLDNNIHDAGSVAGDIQRFVNLILGSDLVRPKLHETGMYFAYTASLRSSCLSRQVGASLQAKDGTIVATGANDVPAFGGGICGEDKGPTNRCFIWESTLSDGTKFVGCHNSRKKQELRTQIADWMGETFSDEMAATLYPKAEGELDTEAGQRENTKKKIKGFFTSISDKLEGMPGVKDAIEYSRSIHAEMNTLFNAAANNVSPVDCILFTTTFPCHNCARHLVTAGVKEIFYIEPYLKSLALELHSDAISTEREKTKTQKGGRMLVLPYTGIGPSIYDSHFAKRSELKNLETGVYVKENGEVPHYSVRLKNLAEIEMNAIKILDE